MKNAVFRVDASTQIGAGHVSRCLALAHVLREHGAKCHFIHRMHEGNWAAVIRKNGFPVYPLPAPQTSKKTKKEQYKLWLGVSDDQDAQETLDLMQIIRPDAVIVDHYGIDVNWERKVSELCERIIVIDDLANRQHQCYALIDQSYFQKPFKRYDGLVPSGCRLFLGPLYALLRPEFYRLRQLMGPRRGHVARVLIFYGGAVPPAIIQRTLDVLSRPEFMHLTVDIVVYSDLDRQLLATKYRSRNQTNFYKPLPHLAGIMAKADLAIGGGGVTALERCAVGLPSIVISVAKNQEPSMNELTKTGATYYLGPQESVRIRNLHNALQLLIDDSKKLQAMAQAAWNITDGLGAFRIAEALCS